MVTFDPTHPGRSTDGFARSVHAVAGRAARLQRGAELVVERLEGCDHAAVTIATPEYVENGAASDDLVARAEAWQHDLSQGPALDVVLRRQTIVSQELGPDRRWPSWAPKVAGVLGFGSVLSVLLYTDRETVGALTLYADRPLVWDDAQVELAIVLAGHLAVAASDAHEIENWGRAARSRTLIGQAEGILMERLDLDADQAFGHLRRISQTTHRKLLAVAHDVVETRRLPPPPSARP